MKRKLRKSIRNAMKNMALILGAGILACAFLLLMIHATVQETEKLDQQMAEIYHND